jgi:hypothetical protein
MLPGVQGPGQPQNRFSDGQQRAIDRLVIAAPALQPVPQVPQLGDQRAQIPLVVATADRFELAADLGKLAPDPFQAVPDFAASAFIRRHRMPPTQQRKRYHVVNERRNRYDASDTM